MRSISFLDSREEMATLDKSNMLASIEQLGQQVQHMWEYLQRLQFDPSYRDVKNIVVAGMGGSSLGTHVIQTLYKDELEIPVIIAPDYTMPKFVDEHTLVIASSYSGTTEETIAATKDAIEKGAKITGITTGGPLAELLASHNYPALIFEPTYNPCNSPRMALGYSVFGQIGLLAKIGLLKIEPQDFDQVLQTIAAAQLHFSVETKQDGNPAKILAFQMIDKLPIIITSEHLEGVTHVFANQLNENAKSYSEYRVIPELNHHLMEGLQFPENNSQNLFFLTLHSMLFNAQNQLRLALTEELLLQHSLEYEQFVLESPTKLQQVFEVLVLGAYTSFYLAMLHNQDPELIPYVDWFKAELKQRAAK